MDITLNRIKEVIYDYLYKWHDDETIHKKICDLYMDLFNDKICHESNNFLDK